MIHHPSAVAGASRTAHGRSLPAAIAAPCTTPRTATFSAISSRVFCGRRSTIIAAAGRGGGSGGDDDADWEAEMSIFKQRISRPNQLATLRELEGRVDLGKVLYARDGLAIVSGLNADAPLGTKVAFVTGAAGVVLWHRSDNLSFCLVLGDPSSVAEGMQVECKISGVLQVLDDVKGPITRKDYEVFCVPTGEEQFGRVVDHIGRHLPEYDAVVQQAAGSSDSSSGSGAAPSSGGSSSGGAAGSKARPLLAPQVEMKNREQIAESLLTGVKALDVLTPLGRGASMLVIGPGGAGKGRLALDAVRAQAAAAGQPGGPPPGGPVRSVLALVGRSEEETQAAVAELAACGALSNTAVLVAGRGAPLGHQLAALYTACSIGERVRDEGGHSLVVANDLRPLAEGWEALLAGLAGLGSSLLREGLIKDDKGRDMTVAVPGQPGEADETRGSAEAAVTHGSPSAQAAAAAEGDEEALVEYEGMLVSGAVAQRRGFLSTFFMRAAKMARQHGGGSMSLLPMVPGCCATGVSKRIDMSKYKTLSPAQIAKLEAALRAKALAEDLAGGGAGPGELAVEAVEEFISIADGQLVLEGPGRRAEALGEAAAAGPGAPAYLPNPKLSITRIGKRAFYKALEVLAPQVRLDLAQADDARRFGAAATGPLGSAASGSSLLGSVEEAAGGGGMEGFDARTDAAARRLAAAMLQRPGRPLSLAEQVVTLLAVQRGHADGVPATPAALGPWLEGALEAVAAAAPGAMQELGRTGILTAAAEAAAEAALREYAAQAGRAV